MNRPLELSGPEQFVEASTRVIEDPTCDVVIVRNLLSQVALDGMHGQKHERVNEIVRNDVPGVAIVDDLLPEWWKAYGYTDFMVASGFQHDTEQGWRKAGSITSRHVDSAYAPDPRAPIGQRDALRGLFSASIGINGVAHWRAHRPSTTLHHEDRSFDRQAWLKWYRSAWRNLGPLQGTKATQGNGDAVIFPQHPEPAAHIVKKVDPQRSARVFDIRVKQVAPSHKTE